MSDPPYRIRGWRGDDVTSAQRTQPCDPWRGVGVHTADILAARGDTVNIADTFAARGEA